MARTPASFRFILRFNDGERVVVDKIKYMHRPIENCISLYDIYKIKNFWSKNCLCTLETHN